jgi:hypothetical protein
MTADLGHYDVAVLGGGNAGLSAALTARQAGARVIVIEAAPRHFRGGNSRHTRNLRCAHAAPTDVLTDAYPEDELMADLLRVNDGETDEALARLVVEGSSGCPDWMRSFGARFQTSLRGTLQLSRTNAFFLGGGTALMNSYYAAAERLGITVLYDAEVVGLELREGAFRSAAVRVGGETRQLTAKAVVLAAGGFEANLDWLQAAWGDAARNFIVRGTPYNKGTILRIALDAGAAPIGDPRECHAVAIDGRAPKFDGGIVTRSTACARHRREPPRRAFLDEARISGRSVMPSGASSSRASPARSRSRSSTQRCATGSCPRCFRRSRPARSASWRHSSAYPSTDSKPPSRPSTTPCRPAPSITLPSTTAARSACSRRRRIGRSASTRRRFGVIRCAPESRSRISACA